MATIAFQGVTKRYPGAARAAVDDVTFEVQSGAVCMLLGTSGSGKTTLLRMVNRLIEPTAGVITLDGHNVLAENPVFLRRRIGYVIQQVGLFPHMTVAENVRVTAEIAGWPRERLAGRVEELLRLVGLPPAEYQGRFPRQLSGGEQQRVGLARALASDPAILLMDEPFGALDAITRARMQEELRRIQRGVRKTILFVTHDVDEAFRLGDQIAVLSEGRLVQLGTPVDLLARPASEFVRRLVGADNVLRQLEYLPVTAALEAGPPDGGGGGIRCASDTTLLEAMLRLIDAGTALSIYDAGDGRPLGRVTLSSLGREIVRASGGPAGDGAGTG
jgi:osmoprotectant transport system ATP-binding protein